MGQDSFEIVVENNLFKVFCQKGHLYGVFDTLQPAVRFCKAWLQAELISDFTMDADLFFRLEKKDH